MKKCGQKDAANKSNTMGGGEAKAIDDKLDDFALSLECTPSFTKVKTNDTATLDSGGTRKNVLAAAPCSEKQAAHVPLNLNMPNGTTI
jgi:hypothetical protein